VMPDSPAAEAGMVAGDRIVEINRSRIETFSDVQRIIALAAGDELRIVVERDGELVELTATPERREIDDGFGGTQRVGVLGIQRSVGAETVTFERYPPLQAVGAGIVETGVIIERTLTYVQRLFAGRETADQLRGPVGIVHISGVIATAGGLLALIHLTAVLSVAIGLINLFPIPMLDGGHLTFYAVEAVRRRPLSARAQEMAFRIGFALVIMLFVFVTYQDLIRLSGL
jgi:regulator of sigma E protease